MPQYDTKPNFDVEAVRDLLEIVDMTREQPSLKAIHDDALRALAGIAAEVTQRLTDQANQARSTTVSQTGRAA